MDLLLSDCDISVTLMLRPRHRKISARSILGSMVHGVVALFRRDLWDSKWGHRVMDQVFREGRFSPNQD